MLSLYHSLLLTNPSVPQEQINGSVSSYVQHFSPTYSFSLFFSFISLFSPFFISPSLSLCTFLEHILLALALTNTLSHRLWKKKRIGVGVVEWRV